MLVPPVVYSTKTSLRDFVYKGLFKSITPHWWGTKSLLSVMELATKETNTWCALWTCISAFSPGNSFPGFPRKSKLEWKGPGVWITEQEPSPWRAPFCTLDRHLLRDDMWKILIRWIQNTRGSCSLKCTTKSTERHRSSEQVNITKKGEVPRIRVDERERGFMFDIQMEVSNGKLGTCDDVEIRRSETAWKPESVVKVISSLFNHRCDKSCMFYNDVIRSWHVFSEPAKEINI